MIENESNGDESRQSDEDCDDNNEKPKPKKPKNPCPEDHPCDDWPGDEGPPTSGCDCHGHCDCECNTELPAGSVRRVFEKLRQELKVPPECEGAPRTAKDTFETALQECETEYQGINDLVQAYRDFHCEIDCKLEDAEDWCKEIRTWCERLDKDARECIERIWYEEYEKVEFQLECCCYLQRKDKYESMKDCLEQARAKEDMAQEDFETVKGFLDELKARFDKLEELYGAAKEYMDSKNDEAVCAVFWEFRKIYHSLHQLILWADRRRRCKRGLKPTPHGCKRPKKIKDRRGWKWYRGRLLDALRALLEAKYRVYCFEQAGVDAKHCMDVCKEDLDEFKESRTEKFILEAQDCSHDDEC